MIREQMALIQEVQSDEWWQDAELKFRATDDGGALKPRPHYAQPLVVPQLAHL